jgi:xylulose-5-phosphate/fructose-6-phosphate phosphoketolase
LTTCSTGIAAIQTAARAATSVLDQLRWPMIALRSLKGWIGPKEVDGFKAEGFWRARRVPVDNARGNDEHRKILEDWMRSYQPEKLFDSDGRLREDLRALAPTGNGRMGANANGGLLKRELKLPDFHDSALEQHHVGLHGQRPGNCNAGAPCGSWSAGHARRCR